MKMIKYILLGAVLGLTATAQAGRERISLDADWAFHLGDQSLAQTETFDDSEWRTLDVPHDWSIECAFSKTNAHQNAWLPGGIGWYRKEFTLAPNENDRRVQLQFDGVYKNAQVWVNGTMVGAQSDGYTSFYFDITPQVRFGESNIIAVRADNSTQPNCRWYTGSGIYRHVWLTITDPLHVETWGTAITTPAITKSEALVQVVTTINNQRGNWAELVVETDVFNPNGEKVATETTKHPLRPKQSFEVAQTLSVFSPERWSLDTPNLYTAVTRLKIGKNVVDEVTTPFGIRSLRFDAKQGFFLNGEHIKMKGVCLHAEAGTFGAAIPLAVWERRLTGLKKTGCNAIRTAHNAAAPEFMDLCDRMGFLVMDEFVDKWDDPVFADPDFHSEWKQNFGETIRRDRNHPSVVIWSVGNENHAPGSEEQTDRLEAYCDFVRSIDPTRPVVSGMERGADKDPSEKVDDILRSSAHMDLIGMNYGLQWSKRIADRNPGKAFVSTESCFYYGSTEEKRWAFTERPSWFDVAENDSNIGLFLWSGIKYLGEIPGKGKFSWPNIFCWPSAFLDSAAFRTPISYYYESLWSNKPMVHAAVYDRQAYHLKRWDAPVVKETWNHPEQAELDLVTYTNCEYVELYLNGRRIGTQKLSDFSNRIMNWHQIKYEPGTLKAVGFRNGKAVCEFELNTADEAAAMELTPEIHSDLSFVEIQLTDKAGNPVRNDDRDLDFQIAGGKILSLDNGALNTGTPLQEKQRRQTNEGRCLAVIQSDPAADQMVLTVRSAGLPSTTITLP